MAVSQKSLNEALRTDWVEKIHNLITGADSEQDVLRVASNKIALPVLDSENDEKFILITISVPTVTRDDNEPYDGYAEAESYSLKCAQKEQKKRAAAEKKAQKIARDKEAREKKAAAQAKRAV